MSRPSPEVEELKARGNALYQRGKYGAAIETYTEAITLCPRWLPLILNRALCHRKKKLWAAVKADCLTALDIDRDSIKANYMLGLSLIAERRYAPAIQRLTKALECAREKDATMQDEIWRELARAKYLEWELLAAERARRWDALEAKLGPAMEEGAGGVDGEGGGADEGAERIEDDRMDVDDDDAVVDLTRADDEDAAAPRDDTAVSSRRPGGGLAGGTNAPVSVSLSFSAEERETLRELFRIARRRDDRSEDPPDCFCCKLTLEVFRDPVTCPSGHSYERSAVTTHLRVVGTFDPVTREPMTEKDLRPNIWLRNAAHEWLNAHAWAYADIVKPDAPLGGED